MPRKRLDLTGQRFGMLTATECLGTINARTYFAVKCDCGNEELVASNNLQSGKTTTCGCSKKNLKGPRNGATRQVKDASGNSVVQTSTEYNALRRIKDTSFFVDEWNDFSTFKNDIGLKPSVTHRLARKDVRKPHGPLNTYWKQKDEKPPTHAELGDEFFLDMRRAFTRTTKTTQERKRTARCVLR